MQSKKRKAGGNAAFQAQQKLAAEVWRLPAGRQADWLRACWRGAIKVSDLETEVITGASLPRTLAHLNLTSATHTAWVCLRGQEGRASVVLMAT